MKKSEELKQQAHQEDNDFKALGLYIKSNREKKSENFIDVILPILIKHFHIETDANGYKYTIDTGEIGYGLVDFFPKKGKLLIRKDNKWTASGKLWLIENLIKFYEL